MLYSDAVTVICYLASRLWKDTAGNAHIKHHINITRHPPSITDNSI